MEKKQTLEERIQESARTGRRICFRREYLLRNVYHRYVDTYVWCRRFCEHYELCKLDGNKEEDEVIE